MKNGTAAIEAGGADIDIELVNTVFRAVHSVKGATGFFGLNSINNVAHSFEDLLILVREFKLVPTEEIIDPMLRAADMLRNFIQDIENANSVDVSSMVSELKLLGQIPSEDESKTPTQEQGPSEDANCQDDGSDELDEPTDNSSSSDSGDEPVTEEKSVAQQTKIKAGATKNDGNDRAKNPSEFSIRVSVDTLDTLMNFAGELVLGRNQLLQSAAHCRSLPLH
ncbi:MAG TPA: hypothetical protein EYQ75_03830 [Planctomycetaceae bacterium]|nr:hypothetical protein [Planctomycetaceae bacterium]